MLWTVLICVQLAATAVMGVYFFVQLRKTRRSETPEKPVQSREMERLKRMRAISLSSPLAERVRPARMKDVIGQEDGVRSLRAILCGKNPQHVLIYGPPGIGKTCAARLVLDEAKESPGTPFLKNAPFIEADATCMRFDERAIADPLIGSVHDPIYQGAGSLGAQGIPQPKPGAVTKAHGGVLFLDEIGELHPTQMNKLLKVLEDRKVMLESAYYDPDDPSVPRHIREIFEHGLPADFRLVGATTRSPQEISPALRSRCMEVFFRPLTALELAQIAQGAAERAGFTLDEGVADSIGRYAACGREAVNMVQMGAGLAQMEERANITREDMAWVVRSGHYAAHHQVQADRTNRVGAVHGLAVSGHQGALLDVEAVVTGGMGQVHVTGIIDTEELGDDGRRMRRKSNAACSAENVRTLLAALGYEIGKRDVHINFPGGAPVDGPSAGAAMTLVAVSALSGRAVDGRCAVTGEITVHGHIRAVGGIPEKIEAARLAGLQRVYIPKDNADEAAGVTGIRIIPVASIRQLLGEMLLQEAAALTDGQQPPADALPLAASGETAPAPVVAAGETSI